MVFIEIRGALLRLFYSREALTKYCVRNWGDLGLGQEGEDAV